VTLHQDTVLEVDFNNLDAHDRVVASLRFSNRWERPSVGDWVRLIDGEHNTCVARVEEIRNLIVALEPDWSSWASSSLPSPFVASHPLVQRSSETTGNPDAHAVA
jgi:hypothetical protein